jgi:hypothetical protein
VESDRRHLLAPSIAPSVATSRAPSIKSVKFAGESSNENGKVINISDESEGSSSSDSNVPRPYRGFPSQEAYLAALLEFGREKQYFETEQRLIGFYGTKTVEDRLREGGGHRSKSKAARKAEKERRKSEQLSKMPAIDEDGGEVRENTAAPTGRWNRLSRVLSRRASVA